MSGEPVAPEEKDIVESSKAQKAAEVKPTPLTTEQLDAVAGGAMRLPTSD